MTLTRIRYIFGCRPGFVRNVVLTHDRIHTAQTLVWVHRASSSCIQAVEDAHSASSDVTSRPQDCAGNSGPNCNTLCGTQPVQGNGEICGWTHPFWFGTLHHLLSLKQLKMYVYFFTNPASSPFKCQLVSYMKQSVLMDNNSLFYSFPLFTIAREP